MTPPLPGWQNPNRRAVAARIRAWLEREHPRREATLRIPEPVADWHHADLDDVMPATVAVIRKAFVIGPGAGCCWMHRYLVGLDEQTGEPLAAGPVVDVHPINPNKLPLEPAA